MKLLWPLLTCSLVTGALLLPALGFAASSCCWHQLPAHGGHRCPHPPAQPPLSILGSARSRPRGTYHYFKAEGGSFPGDTSGCSWGWTQDPSLSKGLRGGGDRCHLPAITAMGQPQPCSPEKPTYSTDLPTAHVAPEDVGKLCPGCSSRQAGFVLHICPQGAAYHLGWGQSRVFRAAAQGVGLLQTLSMGFQ